MIKYLPNIISLLRVLLSPVFFVLIISENPSDVRLACVIYGIAAITDYFDGFLARKYNIISAFGKFLDPLADKFLTGASFIAFVVMGLIPLWMVIIVLTRDIGTTLLRVYADSISKPLTTSWSAKVKTFIQMTFIFYLLILLLIIYTDLGADYISFASDLLFSDITYFIMLALTVFTVWTAIEYIYQNKVLFSSIKLFGKGKSA
jgi:CDP-diacylglycerol---glycerol-3-phosphate 3-phosphatidyltransferase